MVEAAGIDRGGAIGGRRKDRPAVLDPGAGGHAGEQGARPRLAKPSLGPADEGAVDVVRGHCGRHRIEMGLARNIPLGMNAGCNPDQMNKCCGSSRQPRPSLEFGGLVPRGGIEPPTP